MMMLGLDEAAEAACVPTAAVAPMVAKARATPAIRVPIRLKVVLSSEPSVGDPSTKSQETLAEEVMQAHRR
jgi:hypothetical protein